MFARPETLGVQTKTRSGELSVLPQAPASWLDPDVLPVKTPPAAGTTVDDAQVPPGRVVDVVGEVVVEVVPPPPERVTGTDVTLFVSSISEICWKGSSVTRRLYVPAGTPVMSMY